MRHIILFRFSRIISVLFVMGIFLVFPAMAQPLHGSVTVSASPDSAAAAKTGPSVSASDTPSGQYLRGQKTARRKAFFPGTFSAGFLVGMSMPIIGAGVGKGVGTLGDGNDVLQITAGTVGVGLWIWGGKWLISQPEIKAAKRYRKGISGRELADFDAGYANIAQGKRSAAYTAGVVSGVIVDATVVGLLVAAIASSDWGYGDPD